MSSGMLAIALGAVGRVGPSSQRLTIGTTSVTTAMAHAPIAAPTKPRRITLR
jgi:hypothetical protein